MRATDSRMTAAGARLLAALAVTVAVAIGCSGKRKPPAEKPDTRPATSAAAGPGQGAETRPPGRETVVVGTAEELVAAVGPDRVIQLKPGSYDLTGVKQRYLKHVYWQDVFDGYELVFRKVRNLTIAGPGADKATLAVSPRYAYVLGFEDVRGLELVGLRVGHAPLAGECAGGVVKFDKARDVTIRQCVLFGCGTEGLTLRDVEELKFLGSTITGCTYGIMTVGGCSKLLFKDSEFRNNNEFFGFVIRDSNGVKLEDCLIEGNTAPRLFDVISSSDVEVIGGRIRGNRFDQLVHRPESMKIERTEISGNSLLPFEDE